MFASSSIKANECVILLHGLARTDQSMSKMAKKLSVAGYQTVNQNYESTKHSIEKLSTDAISQALISCGNAERVHFVTHSLGGILVRYYLQSSYIKKLGRVVMLGPPNQGSEVVDKLAKMPGFEWFNGPAGMQLGTDAGSMPRHLGPVKFDLGVIAGTRSVNLILSKYLPNPDDGKVSVASTKVKGMRHHISLPVTHTFMMRNKTVINQVLYYLHHGRFNN